LKSSFEFKPPKYDEFVPRELQRKAVVTDFIDLEGLAVQIAAWRCGTLDAS